jgi:hypothetical protein
MNTEFQTKQRIVIMPLVLGFAVALLLCSSAPGQTQISPNPNYGTIIVDSALFNEEYFENFGAIEMVEMGMMELVNESGAVIANAGTMDLAMSMIHGGSLPTQGLVNYGTVENLAAGIINTHSGAVEGNVNNYGHIIGYCRTKQGTFNNYGTIVNTSEQRASAVASIGGTFNNYGTIDFTYSHDLWPKVWVMGGGIFNNYGTILGGECDPNHEWGLVVMGVLNTYATLDKPVDGNMVNARILVNHSDGTIDNAGFLISAY